MWFLVSLLSVVSTTAFIAEDGGGFGGPVFEEQPIDTIYPVESTEEKVSMNCRARGTPPPAYRWTHNDGNIDMTDERYIMAGGNLVIHTPDRWKDSGKYICYATNKYGTIYSKAATLSFGYLDFFSPEERREVKIKEGIGAVLLCDPPDHYPEDLTYRWLLNDFPSVITPDKRRFVSQITGNLYIAKVEPEDKGNYSCFVQSPSVTKSVFSKFIPLNPQLERSVKKYPADIKVRFQGQYALTGQNVSLECFALGNPVPNITWIKVGEHLPVSAEETKFDPVLKIINIQPEDDGTYECKAQNDKGTDTHQAKITVRAFPEWVQHINNTERDIGSELVWTCIAKGIPEPSVTWWKNGRQKTRGTELRIDRLTAEDAGMYQCVAQNALGIIHANAELKVITLAPSFEVNPVKRRILAVKGGKAVVECKPKAAPKPHFSWSKGTELLRNSSRMSIWSDGSLEIWNITRRDEGSYTCYAENDRGSANSTGILSVLDATKITLAPSNADITVGENTTMQCHASHDPTLDLTFVWSQNGYPIDFDKESNHYERKIMNGAGGEIVIKNAQLKHAGRYTCTAQTIVDHASAFADVTVRGPPGPPGGVRVEEIQDTSVTLTWSHGTANGSPISKYTIQAKNMLSEDWKDVKTEPSTIEGNMEMAKVIDLIPWMDYEFRIIATNTLGTGDPSLPSPKIRTLEAAPTVAPSDVSGGGGTNRELTITWTPLSREYHYGNNFGYIVAFKPHSETEWRKATITNPELGRYVHKDDSMAPTTLFEVKVKAYNNKGSGPYSLTAVIYSAEDAPTEAPTRVNAKVLSSSEAIITWQPILQPAVSGYHVRYWRVQDKEAAAHRVQVNSFENTTKLENLLPNTRYHLEVIAFNTAGSGPPSSLIAFVTKKAPPSRAPSNLSAERHGSRYIIRWQHVDAMANESVVDGYKVLYRPVGQAGSQVYTTSGHQIEIPVPKDGEYIVEVRAHSQGGDGGIAQIKIKGSEAGGASCWKVSISLVCVLLFTSLKNVIFLEL
ncbi:contactin-1 [Protopterus annectens]|uniref:contactin-1 n=1 Tax=Protopterus annectens TaxID=7888 RepID=UPI001CFB3057|nr:contactin-1 [Protopterus annectens]XP_043943378.1 contactin-1 [Protopterus annectens]